MVQLIVELCGFNFYFIYVKIVNGFVYTYLSHL